MHYCNFDDFGVEHQESVKSMNKTNECEFKHEQLIYVDILVIKQGKKSIERVSRKSARKDEHDRLN
jgi:hypothetical protein